MIILDTLSLGKCIGSMRKQHHKHTTSETHSHRQWSHQMKIKKNHGKLPKQLRPGLSTRMSTRDLFLPNTAWQWSAVCYYRIRQLGPRNGMEYVLLSVCFCLAVWLCLIMGSGNMVLMRLPRISQCLKNNHLNYVWILDVLIKCKKVSIQLALTIRAVQQRLGRLSSFT